jgi:phage-related protein
MKIHIILNGKLKNRVIERNVEKDQLIPFIMFVHEHGLFVEKSWFPPYRIKEVRYDEPAAPKMTREFYIDEVD